MTQTKKTLFNVIDDITWKKTPLSEYSDEDKKSISSYMINRYLSMRMELTELVNELQVYTIGQLRPQETYKLYHELLPSNKAFAKYIKGRNEDKYEASLINQIAEHYQVGKAEATDYIDLMDKDALDRIISMYGYTDGEKKKLLKGVK